MLEFLDCVIVLYVNSTRAKLELPEDQVAPALFDVFAAHRCFSALKKLSDNHIHQVFVLATSRPQCQLGIQALMKGSFSRWYAGEVTDALDKSK